MSDKPVDPSSTRCDTPSAVDDALVDPDECQPSRFSIFRDRDIVTRQPATDKIEVEVHQFTFSRWLDHYFSYPSFAVQRQYLLSDEQYCVLLSFVVSGLRKVDFIREKQLDDEEKGWLYHAVGQNTRSALSCSTMARR